ncbi:hypothetical protein [Burkholderia sp. AU45388]|uniref:hypothetical protein n=1 Tax=Burkholderia sp. AU45388 TaxID=3059206 RepID=UPI0026541AA6|nr:hypothetical protein [Burkholderia sp. AU45388]MDN7429029.1 hypothetical protein [Burkholderia sp. AU45388]
MSNELKMVTACCGRSECGGECGNEWLGMHRVATRGVHALRDVISNLRETGWYRDEEGEETEALDELCLSLECNEEPVSDGEEAAALRAFDKTKHDGHSYDLESYCAGYIDRRYDAVTVSLANEIADELDAIADRITRFSNSTGDGTCTRAAQLLRMLVAGRRAAESAS